MNSSLTSTLKEHSLSYVLIIISLNELFENGFQKYFNCSVYFDKFVKENRFKLKIKIKVNIKQEENNNKI